MNNHDCERCGQEDIGEFLSNVDQWLCRYCYDPIEDSWLDDDELYLYDERDE